MENDGGNNEPFYILYNYSLLRFVTSPELFSCLLFYCHFLAYFNSFNFNNIRSSRCPQLAITAVQNLSFGLAYHKFHLLNYIDAQRTLKLYY